MRASKGAGGAGGAGVSGLRAGRVQLWGATDRVIRVASRKARYRPLQARPDALPARRGVSPSSPACCWPPGGQATPGNNI